MTVAYDVVRGRLVAGQHSLSCHVLRDPAGSSPPEETGTVTEGTSCSTTNPTHGQEPHDRPRPSPTRPTPTLSDRPPTSSARRVNASMILGVLLPDRAGGIPRRWVHQHHLGAVANPITKITSRGRNTTMPMICLRRDASNERLHVCTD